MNYYVYRYIRLDTKLPFYVGKGKLNRARNMCDHNDYCKNIANKHGFKIEYIMENLTEEASLSKEIEFIKLYKDLGYCEANFTNGGKGNSGYKHTEEAKKRIGLASKGNKHCLGYKHSIEQSMSKSVRQRGVKMPKGHGLGIKNSFYGKKHSNISIERIRNTKTELKPFHMNSGGKRKMYNTVLECIKDNTHLSKGCISLCLNNKRKKHKSYTFVYI